MSKPKESKFFVSLTSAMRPVVISSRYCHQRHKFVFNIPPSQRKAINGNKFEKFRIQVLMRIGLLCGEVTVWDKIPQGFHLRLNNNCIRCSKSPINLTPYIRALKGLKLNANVSWYPGNKNNFVFTVVILKMKNCNDFTHYIRKRIRDKVPILQKANSNEDAGDNWDLKVTSQNVSLSCPLGIKRIEVPVLGKGCNHLQCFDAITFFSLNLFNPKWVCPVCLKPTYPQDLVIDGLWNEILSKAKTDLVSIKPDGSWTPVNPKFYGNTQKLCSNLENKVQ